MTRADLVSAFKGRSVSSLLMEDGFRLGDALGTSNAAMNHETPLPQDLTWTVRGDDVILGIPEGLPGEQRPGTREDMPPAGTRWTEGGTVRDACGQRHRAWL